MYYARPTVANYSRCARKFCGYLKDREVTEATPSDIREYLMAYSTSGVKLDSIRNSLYALRNFFDFLNLGGMVSNMPPRIVHLRPRAKPIPRVLSVKSVLRMIQAASHPRDRALIEFMYATGCRASEVAALRAQDIDLDSRTARVVGKDNKPRVVVFGTPAASALEAYLKGRNIGYVFQSKVKEQVGCVRKLENTECWVGEARIYSPKQFGPPRRLIVGLGGIRKTSRRDAWLKFKSKTRHLNLIRPLRPDPIRSITIRGIIALLALRAGLGKVTPHMIRHCFATHMLDGGSDIREIQELLGHASITSTEIYTHVSRAKLLATFDRCHPRGDKSHELSLTTIPKARPKTISIASAKVR